MKISATIITLNEEKNIGDCLASLDWADEIVVVDSGSSDRTEEICRANPKVRFFHREWEGFGRQKNIAAELAANVWIFNIDADERVSPQLRQSIVTADFERFTGFRVARENYFGKRWIRHCGWYPDYNLRLYDRRRGCFGERAVHEAVSCDGQVGTLAGNLAHYTYSGIADYLRRMDRYSTLAAEEIVKAGKVPGAGSVFFRPLFTVFKMLVLKKGFLEGYTGVVLSVLYGVYTFSKYAKAREALIIDRQ
ncbi:MAG: glycosyltransferase family 2 protein [Geobacter sp.]|nr:glycosyltransferase family 2 protein [Geobacter sp.]